MLNNKKKPIIIHFFKSRNTIDKKVLRDFKKCRNGTLSQSCKIDMCENSLLHFLRCFLGYFVMKHWLELQLNLQMLINNACILKQYFNKLEVIYYYITFDNYTLIEYIINVEFHWAIV